MKAVLYRPSSHKVVDIAPLASGAGSNTRNVQSEPASMPASAEMTTPPEKTASTTD